MEGVPNTRAPNPCVPTDSWLVIELLFPAMESSAQPGRGGVKQGDNEGQHAGGERE